MLIFHISGGYSSTDGQIFISRHFNKYKDLVENNDIELENNPMTVQEFYQLMIDKNERLKYFSDESILSICGFQNVSMFNRIFDYITTVINFYKTIREELEKERGFCISTNTLNCESDEDYLYNNYSNFVITYGKLKDPICFSVQDLLGSFIINSAEDYTFRRPDKPNTTFSYEDVKNLYDIINQQDPELIPGFRGETQPLLRLLRPIFTKPPPNMTDILNLPDEDKEILIDIMIALFEAGMYQRTWKGPGHPYPYKKSDTKNSTLAEIECAMNPSFAEINELNDKLSPEAVIMFKNLPAVYKYIPLTYSIYKLWEFLEYTVKGDFCIAIGSAIMIETAISYLDILEIKIKNFNYDQFESDSTHR